MYFFQMSGMRGRLALAALAAAVAAAPADEVASLAGDDECSSSEGCSSSISPHS